MRGIEKDRVTKRTWQHAAEPEGVHRVEEAVLPCLAALGLLLGRKYEVPVLALNLFCIYATGKVSTLDQQREYLSLDATLLPFVLVVHGLLTHHGHEMRPLRQQRIIQKESQYLSLFHFQAVYLLAKPCNGVARCIS